MWYKSVYMNCMCLANVHDPDFVTSCTWSLSRGNFVDTYIAERRAKVDPDRARDRVVATAGGDPDPVTEDPDLKIGVKEEMKKAGTADLVVIKINFCQCIFLVYLVFLSLNWF